jgi:hypothetical protein
MQVVPGVGTDQVLGQVRGQKEPVVVGMRQRTIDVVEHVPGRDVVAQRDS